MRFLVLLAVFVLCANLMAVQYVVTGDITGTTTWTYGNDYLIQNQARVINGATLVIQEGVHVRFSEGSNLLILGAIQAQGSSAFRVRFIAQNEGAGPFTTNIEMNGAENSSFSFSDFMYSAINPGMVRITNTTNPVTFYQCNFNTNTAGSALYIVDSPGPIQVNYSNIQNMNRHGVEFFGSNSNCALTGLGITDCESGVYVTPGFAPIVSMQGLTIAANRSYPIVATLAAFAQLTTLAVSAVNDTLLITNTTQSQSVQLPNHGRPYQLLNPLTLQGGCTLTINSGNRVHFRRWGRIIVGSGCTLVGNGSSGQRVRFLPRGENTTWSTINLETGSTGIFTYCDMVDGGYPGQYGALESTVTANNANMLVLSECMISGGTHNIVSWTGSNPGQFNLQNTFLNLANGAGIDIRNRYITLQWSGLTVSGCGIPLRIPPDLVEYLNTQPIFSGNVDSSILLHWDGMISHDTVFRNWGYPYRNESLNISTGSNNLTIQPGCVFHMGFNTGFTVNGTLNAAGLAGQPVVFTRLPGTTQNWRGFDLEGGCTGATFSYCRFEYGGTLNEYNHVQAVIHLYRADSVVLDHCEIFDTQCRAIYAESTNSTTDQLVLSNVTITNCGLDAVLLQAQDYVAQIVNLQVMGCQRFPLSLPARWTHQISSLTLAGNTNNVIRLIGGGTLATQTLANFGYPWLVSEYGISVGHGQSVTMPPGTVMQFEEGLGLTVNGVLQANGTAEQPIVFTRPPVTTYYWQGLIIPNNGVALLSHCEFHYGGRASQYGSDAALIDNAGGTAVILDNCLFNQVQAQAISIHDAETTDTFQGTGITINTCGTDGIFMNDSDPAFSLNGVTITGCGRHPLSFPPKYAGDIQNLVMSGNANSFIRLFLTGSVYDRSVTFPNHGYEYRLETDISMSAGYETVFAPGTIFRIVDGRRVEFRGNVFAVGTEGQPIIFSNIPGSRGYWMGIKVYHAQAQFSYCTIDYAGSDNYSERIALQIVSPGQMVLSHCQVTHSLGHGIWVQDMNTDDTLTLTDCVIENVGYDGFHCVSNSFNLSVGNLALLGGGGYPISIRGDLVDALSGLTISDYTNQEILINGTNQAHSAQWVDLGVPYRVSGGYTVSDGVTLTLGAGVNLVFEGYVPNRNESALWVNGILNTAGTPENPVIITGVIPSTGSTWLGVKINQPDGPCSFTHTVFSNGGMNQQYDVQDEFNLLYTYNATVLLTDCTFENVDYNLCKFNNSPLIVLDHCQLRNAGETGIICINSNIEMETSEITLCEEDGFDFHNGSLIAGETPDEWNKLHDNGMNFRNRTQTSLSIPYTWWGSIDATVIDATLFDDEEGQGAVNFEPWYDETLTTLYSNSLSAPVGVRIRYLSGSTFRLEWDVVPGAVSYRIESGIDPYGTTWTEVESGLTTNQIDIDVSGMSGNGYFRIIAVR